MATLATVIGRFFEKSMEEGVIARQATGAGARIRPFANEDIFFYVKRIDNSRVVRAADPEARGVCWKLIGSVTAAAALLIGVLLPGAYGLLAGYQIQKLRQERQELVTQQSSLELQEAALLSPARMEELARIQQFVDPGPQSVVYLDSQSEAQVAQNSPASAPSVTK